MPRAAEAFRKYPRSAEKALARKREILDRAAHLFDTVGYEETSIDDIALANDIGKSTLYHYFESREEMLFEMHDVFATRLLDAAAEEEEKGSTPAEQLLSMMTQVVLLNQTLPGYVRVFFENYQELTGDLRRAATKRRTTYRQLIENIVQRGIDNGEFRGVDPAIAAYGMLGMCNWTFQWFVPGGSQSAEEVAALMCDLLLRGLDS